jgi:hypothetical protein
MSGKSSLENPNKFYENVVLWMEKYEKDPAVKTTFRMELDYFNSSSAKHMMKIFRILERINKMPHKQVVIQWCHDGFDHSMQESGEDFQSMLKIDFEFIELE